MGKRATRAVVQARTNQCYRWIAECKTRGTIQQLAADQWGVTERVIDEYIAKARKQILKDWEIDRKEYVSSLCMKLEHVAQASMDSKQHSNAIGAFGLQARILGIEGRQN